MSQLTIKYFSRCLIRPVIFEIILPNDYVDTPTEYTNRPVKTLFLLHGYTGSAYNWVPEDLANKYNFAIVIPSGENSFWLDGISTGHKYETFLYDELIKYVRKNFGLAKTPEDTYIMGFSMGGYGALHTALDHPEVFGHTIALSSALLTNKIGSMKPHEDNGVANYEYYRECFGDLETVKERSCAPEVLVNNLIEQKKSFPEIIMACGTEDFLIESNREFHQFLETKKVPHTYWEAPGIHDNVFWDSCVKKFIPIVFEK